MTWPAFLLLVITGVQRLEVGRAEAATVGLVPAIPSCALSEESLGSARHDGKEKNPDLTHSRPKEQAGESQTASPLGEVAFGAGAQPG